MTSTQVEGRRKLGFQILILARIYERIEIALIRARDLISDRFRLFGDMLGVSYGSLFPRQCKG